MLRDDGYHFGLDADIKKKFVEKYDPAKENAARVWIEALTRRKLSGSLQEELKSGVVLCELINAIQPGTVSAINKGSQPFVQRENIAAYLKGCKSLGMKETDLFVTQDLFEGDNIVVVIDNIFSLGIVAKNSRTFRGTQLVVSGGQVKIEGKPQAAASAAPQRAVPTKPTPSSPPASKPAASKPAAGGGGGGGPKFCASCGAARPSATAKFCAECGGSF